MNKRLQYIISPSTTVATQVISELVRDLGYTRARISDWLVGRITACPDCRNSINHNHCSLRVCVCVCVCVWQCHWLAGHYQQKDSHRCLCKPELSMIQWRPSPSASWNNSLSSNPSPPLPSPFLPYLYPFPLPFLCSCPFISQGRILLVGARGQHWGWIIINYSFCLLYTSPSPRD